MLNQGTERLKHQYRFPTRWTPEGFISSTKNKGNPVTLIDKEPTWDCNFSGNIERTSQE